METVCLDNQPLSIDMLPVGNIAILQAFIFEALPQILSNCLAKSPSHCLAMLSLIIQYFRLQYTINIRRSYII